MRTKTKRLTVIKGCCEVNCVGRKGLGIWSE